MPTLREQTALTAARVRDEFTRSGTAPLELIRHIQLEVARRTGRIITTDQARQHIDYYAEAWAEELLRETDNEDASRSRRGRMARIRQRAADLERERVERARHVPKIMVTKE